MCGDCNAEQYRDLKTPMGKVYTNPDRVKYGHLWMVPEDTCSKGVYCDQHTNSPCKPVSMLTDLTVLGPVVQRMGNAIRWINRYPLDSVVCFVNYSLYSDLDSR